MSTFHTKFINAGLTKCTQSGCYKLDNIIKDMLSFRGWMFLEMDRSNKKSPAMKIRCEKGHNITMQYSNFRMGHGCKRCKELESNPNKIMCDCEYLKIGFKRPPSTIWICEHYNHAILYPDSASEWDYNNPLNEGITPNKIEPLSNKHFWFTCRDVDCGKSYSQTLNHRARGDSCPYRNNKQICLENCLLTTHPNLCKEWDPNNVLKATDVTYGSDKIVSWICDKHDALFKWSAVIYSRTGKQASGCPKCNSRGYDQISGGHDYFIKIARQVHGDKYEYVEQYSGDRIKIKIKCKKHGIFKQTPNSHKRGYGCRKCAHEESESKGILHIKAILNSLQIEYVQEINFEGLRYKQPLRVDIYIPFLNLVIEYDGEQHFKMAGNWGGEKRFRSCRVRDLIKDLYCLRNKINLWRIPYTHVPTVDAFKLVFDWVRCNQICISYLHYQIISAESFDLTNINYITIPYKYKGGIYYF